MEADVTVPHVNDRLLTIPEVAAWFAKTTASIERMVARSEIPFRVIDETVRFSYRELVDWLEAQEGDNRIRPVRLTPKGGSRTVYPRHLQGSTNCWCGEPLDHEWPGKDTGAPHPPEERKQAVVVVREEQSQNAKIERKQLRGYHSTLQNFLIQCINHDGLSWRQTKNEVILYPPDNSRPISVYGHNSDQQMRSLRPWYANHVEPSLRVKPEDVVKLAEAKNSEEHPVQSTENTLTFSDTPAKPEDYLPPLTTGTTEWTTYFGTDGEPNEFFETNGVTVRCKECVGTEKHYETPVTEVTGLGGHIRMNHRDRSNLTTPEAKEKSIYVRRFNRLEERVRQAMVLLADYEPVDEMEVLNLRDEVIALKAMNKDLTEENGQLKARIALIEEAFHATK